MLINGGTGICNYVYIDNLLDATLAATKRDQIRGRGVSHYRWIAVHGKNSLDTTRWWPESPTSDLFLNGFGKAIALGMEIASKFTGRRRKSPVRLYNFWLARPISALKRRGVSWVINHDFLCKRDEADWTVVERSGISSERKMKTGATGLWLRIVSVLPSLFPVSPLLPPENCPIFCLANLNISSCNRVSASSPLNTIFQTDSIKMCGQSISLVWEVIRDFLTKVPPLFWLETFAMFLEST